jgi:hypothetical protein
LAGTRTVRELDVPARKMKTGRMNLMAGIWLRQKPGYRSGRSRFIERCKPCLDEGEFVFALSDHFARIEVASEHCEGRY